jgi:hypothetical protein
LETDPSSSSSSLSIIWQDAWSGQLKQVGIRIPEIQTGTAPLPLKLDGNDTGTSHIVGSLCVR